MVKIGKRRQIMRKRVKKNRLKDYRRLMNWTQSELAKAVGSRQLYISRYERGIIGTPKQLQPKIASVLGLPLEVIFPDNEVLDENSKNKIN